MLALEGLRTQHVPQSAAYFQYTVTTLFFRIWTGLGCEGGDGLWVLWDIGYDEGKY